MSETKIEFKVGRIEFKGEGEKDWLSAQLDKILEKAKDLAAIDGGGGDDDKGDPAHTPTVTDAATAKKTLANFLQEKSATTVQVKKFLATAVWLDARGKKRLSTRDVNAALKSASQSKLNNAADCLNQNVSKGYCEKDGKDFYVTIEGKKSL
jgi:hypothetical protein